MNAKGRRWMVWGFVVLVGGVLAACSPNQVEPALADFSGTWRGEQMRYDACTYACAEESGPYPVVIKILQVGEQLTINFDEKCVYEATASGNTFHGYEIDQGNGRYWCADFQTSPLPILGALVNGALTGRAYWETAGANYCMLGEGCYSTFVVTKD
jgi:hypothetical protein